MNLASISKTLDFRLVKNLVKNTQNTVQFHGSWLAMIFERPDKRLSHTSVIWTHQKQNSLSMLFRIAFTVREAYLNFC